MIGSRLHDPLQLVESLEDFEILQKKISDTLTRMFKHPDNGGNPFLFCFAGTRSHYLANEVHGREIRTAATDGLSFFWNPSFLTQLSTDQVTFVMEHETYHVIFFHCTPERNIGLNQIISGESFDYTVNSIIEHSRSKLKTKTKFYGGVIGDPLPLSIYLNWMDGKLDNLPSDNHCFADITQYGRSPESIHDEILAHYQNSPRRCKEENGGCGALSLDPKTGISVISQPFKPSTCSKCGAGFICHGRPSPIDSHIPTQATREKIQSDTRTAVEQARHMGRGSIPCAIEDVIGKLGNPELSLHDLIHSVCSRAISSKGNDNDWRRYKRRPQYIYAKDIDGSYKPKHRLYAPKKLDFTPKWVALLDASESMSNQDMAKVVTELKLVADVGEGWIIPCDAEVYWNKKTKVTSVEDLKHTHTVGRGGTVFTDFFRDLYKEMKQDFDLAIVLTDGDFGGIPAKLRPNCECVFVLTTYKPDFIPPFGRAVYLHSRNL